MTAAADARWMRRALRQAVASLGATAPNPGVGCVLVRDDVEIGSGRHKRCGGDHGEVAALADCHARGNDPRGSTAYVTLEPCTKTGRTPPCCDALIQAGVARVVWAVDDPNQADAAAVLGAAGVAVTAGCEGALAEAVHGGFLQRIRHGRPRVTGKWAMSLDGKISAQAGLRQQISSPAAMALNRRRRRAFDAIVIGAATARIDNPKLLSGCSQTPKRVVISSQAQLPLDSALVHTIDQAPVLVVCDQRAAADQTQKLSDAGVQVLSVDDAHDPLQVMQALGEHGCNEVLVEGGAQVHGAFLTSGCYDRLECYCHPLVFGAGVPVASADNPVDLRDWRWQQPALTIGGTVVMRAEAVVHDD